MNPSTFAADRATRLLQGLRGVFNLNDSRWGRDPEAQQPPAQDKAPSSHAEGRPENNPSDDQPHTDRPSSSQQQPRPSRGASQGQQPPDLDELWQELNNKLGGLFGGGGKRPTGQRSNNGGSGNGGGNGSGNTPPQAPNPRAAGVGMGLIAGVAAAIWLGTGFFIVEEGQQAVITQFGRYHSTVGAGFNWRLPYPIQKHELVFVTQIRSVDIGRDTIIKSTGLRDSAMLTEDENIVEIKFAVQYRLNDARAWLFESRNPDVAVIQAAETAVREVVGKMKMDSALAEERDQIAPRVRTLMQTILDRYKVGVDIVGINLQQGGVRPPEQVQAAFDDVLKAGQERERAKNEAQAYANDVIPRAAGAASRLKEEAEAYKARISAQAEGDAQRFASVLTEYRNAPQVTRDRLYTEAMQDIYTNVTKVMVDSRQGSNLLYLPLDKLMQQTAADTNSNAPARVATPNSTAPATNIIEGSVTAKRENARSRER